MDEQVDEQKQLGSPPQRHSRMSIDAASQVKSLERDFSYMEDAPLHQSMAYVMSIQSDRKSDIYERIMFLQDLRRSSNARNSSNNQKIDRPRIDSQNIRKSGAEKKTFHSCICEDQCQEVHCPCFYESKEICIRGICCEQCVRYKTALLNKSKGCFCKNSKCLKLFCKCFVNDGPCGQECKCEGCQNTEDKYQVKKKKKAKANNQSQQRHKPQQKYSRIPQIAVNLTCCSCRKTRCLKKYCSCYFNGKKCGKYCICQKCQNVGKDYNQGKEFDNQEQRQQFDENKGRFGRHNDLDQQSDEDQMKDEDIQKYFEDQDDPTDKAMPKQMNFQPVDFTNMFERMKLDANRRR